MYTKGEVPISINLRGYYVKKGNNLSQKSAKTLR